MKKLTLFGGLVKRRLNKLDTTLGVRFFFLDVVVALMAIVALVSISLALGFAYLNHHLDSSGNIEDYWDYFYFTYYGGFTCLFIGFIVLVVFVVFQEKIYRLLLPTLTRSINRQLIQLAIEYADSESDLEEIDRVKKYVYQLNTNQVSKT